MIIVFVNKEINQSTGREEFIVSHGVDEKTGKVIIMPSVSPAQVGAIFNRDMGEYILR